MFLIRFNNFPKVSSQKNHFGQEISHLIERVEFSMIFVKSFRKKSDFAENPTNKSKNATKSIKIGTLGSPDSLETVIDHLHHIQRGFSDQVPSPYLRFW